MATVLSPSEQRVVLKNIDWNTYLSLASARGESSVPRFTYDRGVVEIMSPSTEHEEVKDTVALIVNVWAEERGIDVRSFGSSTFRREDLERGFEPDACFYIQSVDQIKGRVNLDLGTDPPPDLVIEIDISSSSLDKLPLFAASGIPEVWRYDGHRLAMFELEGVEYSLRDESSVLAGLSAEMVSLFINQSRVSRRPDWLRSLRLLAREAAE